MNLNCSHARQLQWPAQPAVLGPSRTPVLGTSPVSALITVVAPSNNTYKNTNTGFVWACHQQVNHSRSCFATHVFIFKKWSTFFIFSLVSNIMCYSIFLLSMSWEKERYSIYIVSMWLCTNVHCVTKWPKPLSDVWHKSTVLGEYRCQTIQ